MSKQITDSARIIACANELLNLAVNVEWVEYIEKAVFDIIRDDLKEWIKIKALINKALSLENRAIKIDIVL